MQIKMIFLALLLASCGLKPYKMDIHQGNVITAEMREKLKLGMSKQQVRYVLGTPLINDAFHGNRWDYVYRHEQGGKVVEQQRLTLIFLDNSLQSIDDGKQLIQADPNAPKPPLIIAKAFVPVEIPSQPIVVEPIVLAPLVDLPADVTEAVQAWADAWSAKDAAQYFASYADGFKPIGMSKSAWQARREARMSKSKSITVTLSDLKIKAIDDNHASATFAQNYRADSYQDKSRKLLQLEKIDDAWLIVSEQVVK